MGLWLTLIGIGLTLGIIMAITLIRNHESGVGAAIFGLPLMMALLGGLLIATWSFPVFEKEKYTVKDVFVEAQEVRNAKEEKEYVFDNFGSFSKVSDVEFDEIIVTGDKLLVHEIERNTPRTYWRFGSSSRKLILIIPATVSADYKLRVK